jgi:hypothetical protein
LRETEEERERERERERDRAARVCSLFEFHEFARQNFQATVAKKTKTEENRYVYLGFCVRVFLRLASFYRWRSGPILAFSA